MPLWGFVLCVQAGLLLAASFLPIFFFPLSWLAPRWFLLLIGGEMIVFFSVPIVCQGSAKALGGHGNWKDGLAPVYRALCVPEIATSAAFFIFFRAAYFSKDDPKRAAGLGGLIALGLIGASVLWFLWFAYRRTRTHHGLSRLRSAGCLAFAGGFFCVANVVGGIRLWRVAEQRIESDAESAMRAYSWKAAEQPGGLGQPNAMDDYAKAASLRMPSEEIKEVSSILRQGWRDPQGLWARKLDERTNALAWFRTGSRRPFCDFTPGVRERRYDETLPQLRSVFDAAQWTMLRALRFQASGQAGRAAEDYRSVLGFARQLNQQRNFGFFNKFVYAIVLKGLFDPMGSWIVDGRGSSRDQEDLLRAALAAEEGRQPIGAAIKDELRERVSGNLLIAEGESRMFRNDIGAEIRYGARAYNVWAVNVFSIDADRNDSGAASRFIRTLAPSFTDLFIDTLLDPRLIGVSSSRYRLARVLRSYQLAVLRYQVAAARLRVLQAGLAIRAYESKRHRVPLSLDDLVPAYLPEVPRDPFDDSAPLRYFWSGKPSWLVYSLGPDRKDDQGNVVYSADDVDDLEHLPPGDIVLRSKE